MDPLPWDDDEDNQNEDWGNEESVWGGRDGLIFLIDATKPMFCEDESTECPFRISLQV
jgi:hypothetical protein